MKRYFSREDLLRPPDMGKDEMQHQKITREMQTKNTKTTKDISSHLLEWLLQRQTNKQTEDKCWWGCGKWEPWALSATVWHDSAPVENGREVPQKTKSRTTMWSSNCTSGYIPKRLENKILKRYLHSYVYCSISDNSQDIETTQMSINEWTKKTGYIHAQQNSIQP